ncbi:MAG: polyprenyl synthetase family protein [Chloroflexi bacterium]|nr:polyprenyl synthetase family protein [Chloroflexota bacterium]
MMELGQIYQPIAGDLNRVKDELKAISKIDFTWLSERLSYVVRGSGKVIRPALTLLSGTFYSYDIRYLLPMAAAVELMHTATLVHDDAIDKSDMRRGHPTVNKLWGEDIAILMGDYLFAKAGEFVADTQSPRAIKLFSQTLGIISSGEINQFLSAFKVSQNRENYFQRIGGKTASLFSLATQSGGILSHAPEPAIAALRDYGLDLGIAFQIVDDILDFTGTEEALGKPVGSDLIQGTLTLPAMMLIERCPENNPVRNLFDENEPDKPRYLKQAIELIRNSSIIDDCYQVATGYCRKACQRLEELPDKPSRQALFDLAAYVTERQE